MKSTMPSAQKQMYIEEELRISISLLKCGLRELTRVNVAGDSKDLPLLLISFGLERLMKTIICCHHLESRGKFPDQQFFTEKGQGHDLSHWLKKITKDCFSKVYLERIPVAKDDRNYLKLDPHLRGIIQILSDFGDGARYFNLNEVIGQSNKKSSSVDELNKLELSILQEDPEWEKKIRDPKQANLLYQRTKTEITIHIERITRSLCRLLTIGKLGELAIQISPHSSHFLNLRDNQLGQTNYNNI